MRGTKIAKSMPATRVDPNVLAEDLGVDAVRYFLLREVPLGLDGDFTYEALLGRYNSDLANDLGNLVSRALTMTGKFCNGCVPPGNAEMAAIGPHGDLAATARQAIADSAGFYADYAPSRALEAIWALVRAGNRYVDTCQPWKLAKDPDRRQELDHVMRTTLEGSGMRGRSGRAGHAGQGRRSARSPGSGQPGFRRRSRKLGGFVARSRAIRNDFGRGRRHPTRRGSVSAHRQRSPEGAARQVGARRGGSGARRGGSGSRIAREIAAQSRARRCRQGSSSAQKTD